jgi:hypothetical protein
MSELKQIPGVQTRFRNHELHALIAHFNCKNMQDLTEAGKRYESLFFMFDPESPHEDIMPGEDVRLALILADEYVFENLADLSIPVKFKERSKPKPGRPRREPLPSDIHKKIEEEKKLGLSTNEAVVQRLISMGTIKPGQKPRKAKTILRYIQTAEKERAIEEQRQLEEWLRIEEAFSQFAPPPPSEKGEDPVPPNES